jgi:hypothetical protein
VALCDVCEINKRLDSHAGQDSSIAVWVWRCSTQEHYCNRLAEVVASPSVSLHLEHHLGVIEKTMAWMNDHILRLNGTTTLLDNPIGMAEDVLPPIVLGIFMVDPELKMVCVYMAIWMCSRHTWMMAGTAKPASSLYSERSRDQAF